MDARTQRTVLRLGAILIILIVAVAILTFVPNQQVQVLAIGLVAAAVLALEEFLKNTGDNAAPTVGGVNTAIQNNAASVPPPSVAVPEAHVLLAPAPEPTPIQAPPAAPPTA